MNVGSLVQARHSLQQLSEDYFTNAKESTLDQLIKLLQAFPALETDKLSSDSLSRLVGGIYSRKGSLGVDKQRVVTSLFQKIYHMRPKVISSLPGNVERALGLVDQFKGEEAIVVGNQQYPIGMDLLKDEEMSCSTYFASLQVELGDGTKTEIALGLLAHFSEMVRAMAMRKEMQAIQKLSLPMVGRHQFDALIAFLETGQASLITSDNVLPLLRAASYLQIPQLSTACKEHLLSSNLDDKQIIALLNQFSNREDLVEIEMEVARRFNEALSQNPISNEFLETLEYYKNSLQRPIAFYLQDQITDEAVKLLIGFPMRELSIGSNQVTRACFSHIAKMPSLKTLHLVSTTWLDDAAMANFPPNIVNLELTCCNQFTAQGLKSLAQSNVRSLKLSNCEQLEDRDLATLPDRFETLELTSVDIGDLTMQRLGALTQLRSLVISSDRINDKQIGYLSGEERRCELRSLGLVSCPLSDAAFEAVGKMTKLTSLEVSGVPITGVGLGYLPSSLVSLSLYACKLAMRQ